MPDIDWKLIHRCLSGEATQKEKRRLQKWLNADPDHRKLYETMSEVWQVRPADNVEVNFAEEWNRMEQRLGIDLKDTPRQNNSRIRGANDPTPIHRLHSRNKKEDSSFKLIARIAAIILLIALPALYLFQLGGFNIGGEEKVPVTIDLQTVETGKGEKASMKFSDGSRVVLNAMSSVQFPRQFTGERREIQLSGEAFFDIKHQEGRPFVVHSNNVSVEVLGTEFNVNSYSDKDFIEVVVRNGRVAVRQNSPKLTAEAPSDLQDGNSGEREVILTKGQRTQVVKGQLPTLPEQVSLAPYLSWVNGKMSFEGASLKDVVRRLNRYYDRTFEVADSSLLDKRLNATFQREQLDKVLQIITFSLGMEYEQRGDTILFKPIINGERDE